MNVSCALKPQAVTTAARQARQTRSCRQLSSIPPTKPVQASLVALSVSLLSLTAVPDLHAAGLERVEMPMPSGLTSEGRDRNKAVLDAAEQSFQDSELLRSLKERTEQNKDQRKRELLDTYCRRQAELGVGDCAGLRLIPGATKSGVQKRPEWLDEWAKNVLGERAVSGESVEAIDGVDGAVE